MTLSACGYVGRERGQASRGEGGVASEVGQVAGADARAVMGESLHVAGTCRRAGHMATCGGRSTGGAPPIPAEKDIYHPHPPPEEKFRTAIPSVFGPC